MTKQPEQSLSVLHAAFLLLLAYYPEQQDAKVWCASAVHVHVQFWSQVLLASRMQFGLLASRMQFGLSCFIIVNIDIVDGLGYPVF